ncbi:MAG: hypothetical protein U0992_02845 [Planctomycetaceae bacterium]
MPEQAGVVILVLADLLLSDDPQVRQMSAVNLEQLGEEAGRRTCRSWLAC